MWAWRLIHQLQKMKLGKRKQRKMAEGWDEGSEEEDQKG